MWATGSADWADLQCRQVAVLTDGTDNWQLLADNVKH